MCQDKSLPTCFTAQDRTTPFAIEPRTPTIHPTSYSQTSGDLPLEVKASGT